MEFTPEAWNRYEALYRNFESRDLVLAEELANIVCRLDETLDANPMVGRYYATCDGLSLYIAPCCEKVHVVYFKRDVRVAVGFVTDEELDVMFR